MVKILMGWDQRESLAWQKLIDCNIGIRKLCIGTSNYDFCYKLKIRIMIVQIWASCSVQDKIYAHLIYFSKEIWIFDSCSLGFNSKHVFYLLSNNAVKFLGISL